jgi:glutamate formiminotransferase/formiminotetrahydrofolate cyclodeaminase
MDTTTAFLQVLDPKDSSTGAARPRRWQALAAALAAMVAPQRGQGIGRIGGYLELSAAGETLSAELTAGAKLDAEAFAAIKAAHGLPRETADQKTARAQAIQAAMTHATRVPLHNAGLCVRVLELVSLLEGRSNPDALSDLQCGGYLARAGLDGCLANVAINLPSIQDPAVVSAVHEQVRALRALARGGGCTEAL